MYIIHIHINASNEFIYNLCVYAVVYRREKAKKLALERAGGVGDVEGAARAEVGQNYDPFPFFSPLLTTIIIMTFSLSLCIYRRQLSSPKSTPCYPQPSMHSQL